MRTTRESRRVTIAKATEGVIYFKKKNQYKKEGENESRKVENVEVTYRK